MILVLLVAVLAIATSIVLWRRISDLDASHTARHTELHDRLSAQASTFARELRSAEAEHQAVLATLRSELVTIANDGRTRDTDLRDILAGIVTYLDDVPQNFAFNKVEGHHYRLRLPDRLRLELHSESR